MQRYTKIWYYAVVFCSICMPSLIAHAERLKDVANLLGTRNNQLLGYGLVVGLQGTGDDLYSGIGNQSVATMLRRLGVNVDPNVLHLRNVAAVMITCDLPAFVGPGQRLDVTVSSLGNARSLEGGTLVASPLKGTDMKVYAVAQGPLSVGGYVVAGLSGSRLRKNITTVGRIPGGAVVEREIAVDFPQDELSINLHSPDFTTAVNIANSIDKKLAADPTAAAATKPNNPNSSAKTGPWATARDAGTVLVRIPPAYQGRIASLMADLEALDVQADWITRVVVNERTGTVVLGNNVRLAPVAIAHGGLTLEVKEQPWVSQPNALAQGTTMLVQQTSMTAQEGRQPVQELPSGTSLGEVVKALNMLGVSPRDLVAILQALKTAGALRADLDIQ